MFWFIVLLLIIIYFVASIRPSKDSITAKNINAINYAVSWIEYAAKIVEKNKLYLNCNMITMWQLGDVGKGFIIEFYGNDAGKELVEKIVEDEVGGWKVYENGNDVTVQSEFEFSYIGSWNKFNSDVWEDVKRQHPEWNIEKVYPHKSVLKI